MRIGFWIGIVLACQACSSSSSGPTQAEVAAACMHICQCEAGTPDPTCQTDCTTGPGTTSSNSLSSSVSSIGISSGGLTTVDQACVDCFTTAACTDIVNGTACTSTCQ